MTYPPTVSRSSLFLIVAFLAAAVFPSCNKPTLVGADLLPGEDGFNMLFSDTLTLVTTTVREDSLRTDYTYKQKNNLHTYLLGTMNEPVSGKTYAGIFSQFLLPVNNVNLTADSTGGLKLDSVVLTLAYNGFYGDQSAAQSLVVYRLSESMDASSAYYSNKTFTYNPDEIGRLDNFLPNTTDSLEVQGVKYPAHLRVKLEDSFGDSLLAQSGTANFKDNTGFLAYLQGIYIATDTNSQGKGLMYFNFSSSLTRLTLYYSSGSKDSLQFSFIINSSTAVTNYLWHNYNGSVVENYLNNPQNSGDTLLFVQSLSGTKGKIKIPYLQNLGKILINKAELVLTVNNPDSVYSSPSKMLCVQSDSTGKNTFTNDQLYQLVKANYFGGNKISTTMNSVPVTQYRFNLALHIQQIANDPELDYGLFLLTYPSSEIADRVQLGGGNISDASYRMKLNLTYTKIQ